MAIVLKHPFCGDCINFPCDHMKGMQRDHSHGALKSDRGQWCNGLRFEHKFCYDTKGKKVRQLQFYAKLVADDIMFEHHFATIGDIIYYYKDGVYVPDGERLILYEAQQRLRDDVLDDTEYRKDQMNGDPYKPGDPAKSAVFRDEKADCTTNRKNEVVGYIRDGTHISITGYPQEQPINLINLKNGFFDIDKWVLIPHTPDIFSVTQIPINYRPPVPGLDEGAKCPLIDKFLSEIVDEKFIAVLLEMFGYCLYTSYPIRKSFLFQGEGGNGKTTLLLLLRAFLGDKNCTSTPLQQLNDTQRFFKASLFGKLANIHNDLPATALKDTGVFKQLTGQDVIQAEFKFRDGFEFHNYAKLIFACNRVPITPDDTEAFYERWYLMEFTRKFEGRGREDKFLIKKLSVAEELEGLLLRVLPNLKELLAREEFLYTPSTEQTRDKYTRLSDTVSAFVADCTDPDSSAFHPKSTMHQIYLKYCKLKHYKPLFDTVFHKRLKEVATVADEKTTINEKRVMVWYGLKIKDEWLKGGVEGPRDEAKTDNSRIDHFGDVEGVEGVQGVEGTPQTRQNVEGVEGTMGVEGAKMVSNVEGVEGTLKFNVPNLYEMHPKNDERGGVEGTSNPRATRIREGVCVETPSTGGVNGTSENTSANGPEERVICLDCKQPIPEDDVPGELGICSDCLIKRKKELKQKRE